VVFASLKADLVVAVSIAEEDEAIASMDVLPAGGEGVVVGEVLVVVVEEEKQVVRRKLI
jgi:hypothetical protein